MKIFHRETNQLFDDIEIFLSVDELHQLKSYVCQLIENPSIHHIHLLEDIDKSDSKEITIAIVTNDNINEFDERSREVILNNS